MFLLNLNISEIFNFNLLLTGLFAFLISNYVTKFTVPFAKKIAVRFNLFDNPKFRGQHKIPMVRLGGISIFNGFFISFLSILFISRISNISSINESQLILIFLGSALMFFLGLLDDLFQINNILRLFTQFSIATILYSNGLNLNTIQLSVFNLDLNYILTILWLVGITNSINWIDGLDGLASGICIILFSGLFILNTLNQNFIISLLCISMIGCCLGFLKYNTYPAKIFMGDGGSYLLGFFFASTSLLSLLNETKSNIFPYVLLIGLYPITDMVYVISNRIIQCRSPFQPDSNHFHHVLRRKNISHKKSVKIIYLINLFFCTLGIVGILFYKYN